MQVLVVSLVLDSKFDHNAAHALIKLLLILPQ